MNKLGVVTTWNSPFYMTKPAENLAQMMANFRRDGWEADVYFGNGIDPASRHIDAARQALEDGADVICYVGADQIHPVDMLNRLLDRYYETGGDVITAMIPFRGYINWQSMRPFQPLAWQIVNDSGGVRENRGYREDPDLFRIIDQDSPPEMEQVDVIGSGVMLFDRETILALRAPWFYDSRDIKTMMRVADTDTRFIWRLRGEVQAKVWVDKTIRVKHLHTFEIDETFQYRFDDMMERAGQRDEIFRYAPRDGDE